MRQSIKSPFPGVDPYLEDQHRWRDFHSKFINCWQEELLATLPPQYDARMDDDIYVGAVPEEELTMLARPDVGIVESRRPRTAPRGGTAVAEEVLLPSTRIPHTILQERRVTHIEVRNRPQNRLVAVLELLSPTNKTWGREKYLKKRRALRRARVHLVEVDLLIGGTPPPLALSLPQAHCHVLLTRSNDPGMCEVFSWNLADPLPTIPIPLLDPDPEVTSNLRSIFEVAYERGQYPRAIDYSVPLKLPLDSKTRKWASAVAARFAKTLR